MDKIGFLTLFGIERLFFLTQMSDFSATTADQYLTSTFKNVVLHRGECGCLMQYRCHFYGQIFRLNTVVPQGSGSSLLTFSLFINDSIYDSMISIHTSQKLTRSLSNMDDDKVVMSE